MSGLEILIPVVISAFSSTAAAVGTAALAAGSAVFAAGGAIAAGVGLTGTLGAIVGGAISSGVIGGVIGGIGSAVTGGDFLDGMAQGALMGAVTGGIGGVVSGGAAATAASMGGDVAANLTATEAATASTMGVDVATSLGGGSSLAGSSLAGVASSAVPAATSGWDLGEMALEGPAMGSGGPAVSGPVSNGAGGAITTAGQTPSVTPGTQTPTSGGGLIDGLLGDREMIGGVLNGVGKVLSGDTEKARADANNRAAMERQVQGQENTESHYGNTAGLLDRPLVDQGAGRPTPAAQFGNPGYIDPGNREYYFDTDAKKIMYRKRG